MFPTVGPATESTMTGAMLGTSAMVGIGMGLGTIMAISFFCRACRTRGRVPRDKWNGKCTNCGQGVYKRDIKRTTMPAPAQQASSTGQAPNQLSIEDPVHILKVRFAKGEMTPQDYHDRLKILKGT